MTLVRLVILNEVKDLWQSDPLPREKWYEQNRPVSVHLRAGQPLCVEMSGEGGRYHWKDQQRLCAEKRREKLLDMADAAGYKIQ
jgi:hypothetical protein